MSESWLKLDVDFDADPTQCPSPMLELFFPFFRRVAEEDRLAIVTVDWVGCPACGSGSAYIQALAGLPERYADRPTPMAFGSLHWRSPELSHFDDPDLRDVVNQSYRLFHQMTGGQTQVYGGRIPVETFTANPPHWRPKFPQLFFLDGRQFTEVDIDILTGLFQNGQLFHPYLLAATSTGEDWVRSGELNFVDETVRNAVWNSLGPDAVLLQLTNYHLYRAPGDRDADFMEQAMLETCDHVVEQFVNEQVVDPQISFRFERSREAAFIRSRTVAVAESEAVPEELAAPVPEPASPSVPR